MSKFSSDECLGAYNGVPIRCRQSGLISITDIHKANGAPSTLRPDKWLRLAKTQELLASFAAAPNVEPIVDKLGNIIEIAGVLEVFRGGDRLGQGTFVDPSVVSVYVEAFSEDCKQWFERIYSPTEIEESQVVKATKKDIFIGNRILEVYQIPSGEYRLNQEQCMDYVGKSGSSFRDFLKSKSPEALPYAGFSPVKSKAEGVKPIINLIPIPLAIAYWTKESISKNKEASRLLGACGVESIERKADKVFNIPRTELEYSQRFEEVFQSVIATLPETSSLSNDKSLVKVSAPLQGFNASVERKISKCTTSTLLGRTKDVLIKNVALLASYSPISYWKLTLQQELSYKLGELSKVKYPNLTSGIVPFSIKDKPQTAVFMFQFCDIIVKDDDVSEYALRRRYVQIARESMNVDYAYLFLVAPFGASPSAAAFVEECLPDGINGCKGYVGIITLREMLEFYLKQALNTRSQNFAKGKIKKEFDELLDRIPSSPFEVFAEDYIQLSLLLPDEENK